MSGYDLAEIILNQRAFSALVILNSAAALARPDRKSLAVLFFACAYFSTQIPLTAGLQTTLAQKYLAQGIVSLALLCFYATTTVTRYIVFSALCELALIATNIVFLTTPIHQWYHWAIFSTINYLSFISLNLNKWLGSDRHGRVVEQAPRTAYALDHVYSRLRDL